jgi:hypothetical protein
MSSLHIEAQDVPEESITIQDTTLTSNQLKAVLFEQKIFSIEDQQFEVLNSLLFSELFDVC